MTFLVSLEVLVYQNHQAGNWQQPRWQSVYYRLRAPETTWGHPVIPPQNEGSRWAPQGAAEPWRWLGTELKIRPVSFISIRIWLTSKRTVTYSVSHTHAEIDTSLKISSLLRKNSEKPIQSQNIKSSFLGCLLNNLQASAYLIFSPTLEISYNYSLSFVVEETTSQRDFD